MEYRNKLNHIFMNSAFLQLLAGITISQHHPNLCGFHDSDFCSPKDNAWNLKYFTQKAKQICTLLEQEWF